MILIGTNLFGLILFAVTFLVLGGVGNWVGVNTEGPVTIVGGVV